VSDLKPCPFCGSANLGRTVGDPWQWVVCLDCDAQGPSLERSESEATDAWNTRPNPWRDWSEEQPEEWRPVLLCSSIPARANACWVVVRVSPNRVTRADATGPWHGIHCDNREVPDGATVWRPSDGDRWRYLSEVLP